MFRETDIAPFNKAIMVMFLVFMRKEDDHKNFIKHNCRKAKVHCQ